MKNVNTIIFDAGGVLIYINEKRNDVFERILLSSGYEKENIEKSISELNRIDEVYFENHNEIINWKDEKDWWEYRCSSLARLIDPTSEDLKDKLFILGLDTFQYRLYDETIEILKKLKEKYELAILSNATATLDWCFDTLNIRKYFKEIVISSYEESSKPGKDIYLRIIRRMNKNPEDCIFIDDKKENIETAEKLGMETYLLNRGKGENLHTFMDVLETY